eukprot:CAMPEP_0194232588 /NCGR_PEP_ID=MMETSP0158-20130606/903_1 /TAXON_ID=33649 /ORGANISM="Thalassionema nitzschioides, Strain L26-B" /LENGTH=47 /DNA_ID= /DNA_START= /DNA_END= /DNA_ORIENTATION=
MLQGRVKNKYSRQKMLDTGGELVRWDRFNWCESDILIHYNLAKSIGL